MKVTKEYLKKLIKETLQKEGRFGSMTRGLEKAIEFKVEDESGRENSVTLHNIKELEDHLEELDKKGADLYNIIIRPKFK